MSITHSVRLGFSRRLIEMEFRYHGTAQIFLQSQSWEGYERACDNWHDVLWRWIDEINPPEQLAQLNSLQIDYSKVPAHVWSSLPCPQAQKKHWLLEHVKQEHLLNSTFFQLMISGPEGQEPATYNLFAQDFSFAGHIGDPTWAESLARQKQRHPTKDKGDRRLKYMLLQYWIACSLWAFTTDGIGAFLQDYHPRSKGRSYDVKTISDARRGWRLFRAPKPLYWGMTGHPPTLVPL